MENEDTEDYTRYSADDLSWGQAANFYPVSGLINQEALRT